MSDKIDFYFDFASPYGYFASTMIDDLAAEFGMTTEWHPFLMWALIRKNGIAVPMETEVRSRYLVNDMERSARYYDLPYKPIPKPGQTTSHLAARLYYHVADADQAAGRDIAARIFRAYCVDQIDISQEDEVIKIAAAAGIEEDAARNAIRDDAPKARLAGAVDRALDAGVIGSPYFVVGGEGFFGVDRIPQLRWHLERKVE